MQTKPTTTSDKELREKIEICLLSAAAMPQWLSDEETLAWVSKTANVIMESFDQERRRFAEECVGEDYIGPLDYMDLRNRVENISAGNAYEIQFCIAMKQEIRDRIKKHE